MHPADVVRMTSLCLGILCSSVAFLLIVAILTSHKLRSTLRHVTVVSLMTGELLVGWIYCPIMLFTLFAPDNTFHCGFGVASFVFTIAMSVGSWGLVLQHCYYLVTVLDVKPRGFSAFAAHLLRVVACLLPWLLAMVIVLVMVFQSSMTNYTDDGCRVISFASDKDHLLYLAVDEFIPRSLATVLTVACIVAHTFSRRRSTAASIALLTPSPHPIEFPIALNLATVVSLLLVLLPAAIVYFFKHQYSVVAFVSSADALTPAVMPLVWLSDKHIRKRVAASICCHCCHDDDDNKDENETVMSYKSLGEKNLDSKTEELRPTVG